MIKSPGHKRKQPIMYIVYQAFKLFSSLSNCLYTYPIIHRPWPIPDEQINILELTLMLKKMPNCGHTSNLLWPGLNFLHGEKCPKLATLRLIADNISFLRGRLDQAWIVEARSGVGTFELVMVRSYIGHVLH